MNKIRAALKASMVSMLCEFMILFSNSNSLFYTVELYIELNKRRAKFWHICLAWHCRIGRRAKWNKFSLTYLAHLNQGVLNKKEIQLNLSNIFSIFVFIEFYLFT